MNPAGGNFGHSRVVEVEGGQRFVVGADEDTLLRAALRAGVGFPYECSVGGCGACRFDLLEGEMSDLWELAPGLSERDRKRGKRLACQSLPVSDCRIRVRLSEATSVAAVPTRMRAILVNRRAITPHMTEFGFQLPHVKAFKPGQYALLRLPSVEGVRAYSMSGLPALQDLWTFIVRRVEGGVGSSTLFDQVAVGAAVEVDGPYGHAYLRSGDRDVVCVAGGSGVGPMLSIAKGVLSQQNGRRVYFFLGLRTEEELGASAEVGTLSEPRMVATTVLSAPLDKHSWSGQTGFVHEVVERSIYAIKDSCDYYFAGPPAMTEAMQQLLMVKWRIPYARVHFDRFV